MRSNIGHALRIEWLPVRICFQSRKLLASFTVTYRNHYGNANEYSA